MALRRLTADDVSRAAELHGVPPKFALAFWKQESDSGRNTNDSPKGAIGDFQLMPGTFKRVMPGGNIRDPIDNMFAGLAVMKECLQRSGGDPKGAAQCYYSGRILRPGEKGPNSGPGTPDTDEYSNQVLANMGGAEGMGTGVPNEEPNMYGGGIPDEEGIPNEEAMPNEEPDIAGLTRPLSLSQDDSWMQQDDSDYELEQYVKRLVDEELGHA